MKGWGRLVWRAALPAALAILASLATGPGAPAAAPAVSISPASYGFGTVTVGSSSNPQAFVLTNTGTADLHLQGAFFAGANPGDFRIYLDGCSYKTVPAGATCSESAVFGPKEAGPLSATLSFPDDAAGSPQTVSLSGTGTGPVVSFVPAAPLLFEYIPVGQQSAPQTFYVRDAGDSPLTITSAKPVFGGPLNLVVVSDGCSGTTIAAGGVCPMRVAAIATQAVSGGGSIQFQTSALPASQSYNTDISGLGPDASIYAPWQWNNQPQNSTSQPQFVQLQNDGDLPMHVGSVAISGAGASEFAISSDACTGATLDPGSTCQVFLTFTPTSAGAVSPLFSFTDDAPGSPQLATIRGSGIAPGAVLSPSSIDFGVVSDAGGSASQVVTLNNPTGQPMHVTSVATSSSIWTTAGDTCTGANVPAGTSCSVTVKFAPPFEASSLTGTLTFSDDAGTQTVSLMGSGVDPQLTYAPEHLDFGNQRAGTTRSGPQILKITNTSSSSLTPQIALQDGGLGEFPTDSSACAQALAPGASCSVSIVFAPTSLGSQTATLAIGNPVTGSISRVPLTGNGVAPKIAPGVAGLNFLSVRENTTLSGGAVEIVNSGTDTLHVSSVSISGPNAGAFVITGGDCAGAAVAPNMSCFIPISFTPTTTGPYSATLTVGSDNWNGSTNTFGLSGTGVVSHATFTPNPVAFPDTPVGQSATQIVNVMSDGTASLNLGSIAVTGGGAAAYTITSNTCSGLQLPATIGCSVTVSFAPPALGSFPASLSVADDVPGAPQSVPLSGNGLQAHATASPNALTLSASPGTAASPQTVTLTNDGTTTIHVSTVTLNGDPSLTLASDTCTGATLANGAGCTAQVGFAPTARGTVNATLSFSDDGLNSPQTVQVTGIGTQPAVSLSASSLAFGNELVGTTSAPQSVVVTNSGTDTLHLGVASVAAPYSISADGCSSTALAPSGTCTIQVVFAPSTTGVVNSALSIVDDATGSPQSVSLSGTGTQPQATVSPSSLAFGNVLVGSGSARNQQYVTITNSGTADLHVASVTLSGDKAFAIGLTCANQTVAPGASCQTGVWATPDTVGSRSGSLVISDDAPGSPQSVALAVTGTLPQATVSPSSLAFGNVLIGPGSSANQQYVTVTNSGTADLHVTSITLTGNPAFTIGTPCGATTLAPGASCQVGVYASPDALGPRNGSLVVSDDAPGSPQSVALSVTGTQPQASVSPTSLSFGSVVVGPGSSANQQYVTVTNSGTADLHIASATLSGNPAFTIGTQCATTTLAPGASCMIGVYASPDAVGSRSGTLVISDDAPGSPQSVALAVTGIQPNATVTPTSLSFGSVHVGPGSSANQQYVTITNSGTADLHIASVTLSGNPAFTIGTPCTSLTLAPGASCKVGVFASPDNVGLRSGSLVISDDAPGSPQLVTLTVTGLDGQLTASPASINFGSVTVGTKSKVVVTVTNTGNLTLNIGNVTITGTNASSFGIEANSCPGKHLAPGATCSVTVVFKPQKKGALNAQLTFTDDGVGSPQSVPLTGTGA